VEIEFNGVAVSVAASEDWRLILVPGASKRSGFSSFRYTKRTSNEGRRIIWPSRGLPSTMDVRVFFRESSPRIHVHARISNRHYYTSVMAGVTHRSDESETRILHVVTSHHQTTYNFSPISHTIGYISENMQFNVTLRSSSYLTHCMWYSRTKTQALCRIAHLFLRNPRIAFRLFADLAYAKRLRPAHCTRPARLRQRAP